MMPTQFAIDQTSLFYYKLKDLDIYGINNLYFL